MDSLVSTVWLNDHIDDPELIVLDCSVVTVSDDDVGMRNFSGRESYNDGHIPGAGFADLVNDLCDNSSPIEFAMPTPQHFCAVMGALGVGDTSRVVLYDNSFSMWAARVWWMLRWVGLDQAAILDGGLGAWAAEKRPLSTDAVSRATRQLTPDPRPELIADKKEVLSAISDKSVSLIDSLPEEYFRGEQCMYARPGHIPTAKNIPALAFLDESGRYRSLSELKDMHDGDRDERVITYCGGGILASSSAFVMTRLGFTDVSVYTASLQEWAADPANPMVVESA